MDGIPRRERPILIEQRFGPVDNVSGNRNDIRKDIPRQSINPPAIGPSPQRPIAVYHLLKNLGINRGINLSSRHALKEGNRGGFIRMFGAGGLHQDV
jgi:hypothetical protein